MDRALLRTESTNSDLDSNWGVTAHPDQARRIMDNKAIANGVNFIG